MKTWNKTTVVWNFSWTSRSATNIPVTDWKNKEEHFHELVGLSVNSVYGKEQREAEMHVTIARVSIGPTTQRDEIIRKLMNFDVRISGVKDNGYTEPFLVRYFIAKGETFSESAIKMAKALFETLGIDDKKNFRIADFLINQESLVITKDGYIPYADYLRKKQGLPQICMMWGQKFKLGNLTFSMDYKNAESNIMGKMR